MKHICHPLYTPGRCHHRSPIAQHQTALDVCARQSRQVRRPSRHNRSVAGAGSESRRTGWSCGCRRRRGRHQLSVQRKHRQWSGQQAEEIERPGNQIHYRRTDRIESGERSAVARIAGLAENLPVTVAVSVQRAIVARGCLAKLCTVSWRSVRPKYFARVSVEYICTHMECM